MDRVQGAGPHRRLNGTTETGVPVAAGFYLLRLETARGAATSSLLLVR